MRTATTLLALLGLGLGASAQTPFTGTDGEYLGLEQRFNHLQWHATHNSYQRDGCSAADDKFSLVTQLDKWDVWCIELDLRWDQDDIDFEIAHSCAPIDSECGRDSLDAYLDEIAASRRVLDGFTLVDFETWDIGPCFFYPSLVPKPDGWQTQLKAELQARFGSAVYEYSDFKDDLYAWPSAQELIRRGKHLAFKINGDGGGEHDYFFRGEVIYNSDDDATSFNTDDETKVFTLSDLGDTMFARHYPNGTDCSSESDADYAEALANGFTFAATNCSDKSEFRHHPPVPMYVNETSGAFDPLGTWLSPLAGASGLDTVFTRSAIHAYFKQPSMLVASLQGGTYDVTPGSLKSLGGPLSFTLPVIGTVSAPTPVRLTARDGQMVTLR